MKFGAGLFSIKMVPAVWADIRSHMVKSIGVPFFEKIFAIFLEFVLIRTGEKRTGFPGNSVL